MGTANCPCCYPAHQMNALQKKELALNALCNNKIISQLSEKHNVSRKFIYDQKNKATSAIDDAFVDGKEEDEVLFYLPVTKAWIQQLVMALILNCRSCFRGAIKTIEDVLDSQLSVGTIFNIVKRATNKATNINNQQDLKNIKIAAPDELFHHNTPVLAGVDVVSLYCYILSQEKHRDEATWAIHLWDLEKQGFNPERFIADNGEGLRAGHKLAFKNTPCDGDNFHITKTLQELRRFLRNKLKSATTYLGKIENKMEQAKGNKGTQKYSCKLGLARRKEKELSYLSSSMDTLISWMEHEVLNKAGPNPDVRRELYDFIVEEFVKLEKLHEHRIKAVRVALQNQRELLLAFSDVLHEKFELIAEQFSCSTEIIWKICDLQKCHYDSDNYIIRSVSFLDLFGEGFYLMEDAVINAMDTTERTSSMVENLNSRLRPYFFLRKEIGNNYLDLLRFYLNHSKFLRSSHPKRQEKTPVEILTGKKHQHWLELLGFTKFKRKI